MAATEKGGRRMDAWPPGGGGVFTISVTGPVPEVTGFLCSPADAEKCGWYLRWAKGSRKLYRMLYKITGPAPKALPDIPLLRESRLPDD